MYILIYIYICILYIYIYIDTLYSSTASTATIYLTPMFSDDQVEIEHSSNVNDVDGRVAQATDMDGEA